MQTIRADGLVRKHFSDAWTGRALSQMGRMDARSGSFTPRFDEAERRYVDIALGVMRGLFGARMDAAESAFVQRALVFVDGQPYNTLIPPLKSRTFIPTNVKGNPGDNTYMYRRYTRTGMARFIAPGAGLDLPRASLYVQEYPQQAHPLGTKIVYTYFELLAVGAALANGQPVDLVGESLRAAMEAIEKKIDIVAAFGTATPPTGFALEVDVDLGITGLLNNPYATTYTVAVGAAGGTAWSTKTSYEILADLHGIVGSQIANTYEVHSPDTIIVPISQFQTQLTRPMSDVDSTPIITVFQNTRREMKAPVEIMPWMYNAGAGAGSTDLMIAFKRDPRMFEHVLLMDATPLAASTQGLETTQDVVAKTAGVIVRYPLSISLAAGI